MSQQPQRIAVQQNTQQKVVFMPQRSQPSSTIHQQLNQANAQTTTVVKLVSSSATQNQPKFIQSQPKLVVVSNQGGFSNQSSGIQTQGNIIKQNFINQQQQMQQAQQSIDDLTHLG